MARRVMPSNVKEMLEMLAGLPLAERQFRHREILDLLFSMQEEQAARLLWPLTEAKLALSEEEQSALHESELAVLAAFPRRKRDWLLRVHSQVLPLLSEQARGRELLLRKQAARRLDREAYERLEESLETIAAPAPLPTRRDLERAA